jgi:hypothetical protein
MILAGTFLYSPKAEAKKTSFAHVYDNGCIGIRTYHSFLWWEWVTDEIIAC